MILRTNNFIKLGGMYDKINGYEKFIKFLIVVYVAVYFLTKLDILQDINIFIIIYSLFIIFLSFVFVILTFRNKAYKKAGVIIFCLFPIIAILILDPPVFPQNLFYDSTSKDDAIKKGVFMWDYRPSKNIISLKDINVVIDEVYAEKRSQWTNYNMNKIVTLEGKPKIRIHYKYYDNTCHQELSEKPKRLEFSSMIYGIHNKVFIPEYVISTLTHEDTIGVVFAQRFIVRADNTCELTNPIDTIYLYPQR